MIGVLVVICSAFGLIKKQSHEHIANGSVSCATRAPDLHACQRLKERKGEATGISDLLRNLDGLMEIDLTGTSG